MEIWSDRDSPGGELSRGCRRLRLAPVVQRKRRPPPKRMIQVQFLAGAQQLGITPNWDRRVSCGKYYAIYCADHPRAWTTGFIYEHTLFMECMLGRFLERYEVVHHDDEDKRNNEPSNLVLHTRAGHAAEHAKRRGPAAMITMDCCECGYSFTRRANQRAEVKGYRRSFCSRSCSGTFQRRLQLA